MADIPVDGKGNYLYAAKYLGAYDGDSVTLEISKQWDFGFYMKVTESHRIKTRIKGVDTPELRDSRPDWKAAGYLARDKVRKFLEDAQELVFVSLDKPDKYGRALGDIQADGHSLTEFLLTARLGVAYEGQNKLAIEEAHAKNIQWLKDQNILEDT